MFLITNENNWFVIHVIHQKRYQKMIKSVTCFCEKISSQSFVFIYSLFNQSFNSIFTIYHDLKFIIFFNFLYHLT